MSTIIIPTEDYKKYNKDCCNFVVLQDGTLTGDYHYCNLSLECRQIDILPDGSAVSMEACYLPIIDPTTSEIVSHELYCTGKHDLRPLKEKFEDDKVS
jgi:hypothetical protein